MITVARIYWAVIALIGTLSLVVSLAISATAQGNGGALERHDLHSELFHRVVEHLRVHHRSGRWPPTRRATARGSAGSG